MDTIDGDTKIQTIGYKYDTGVFQTVHSKESYTIFSQYDLFYGNGQTFTSLNARSLSPKISEWFSSSFMNSSKVAIVCIWKAWLDNTVINMEVKIDGCNVIYKTRECCGGGVFAYIRDYLVYNSLDNLDTKMSYYGLIYY